jgi:hypothetical protein
VAGLEASAPGVVVETTKALGAAQWCHENHCAETLHEVVSQQ